MKYSPPYSYFMIVKVILLEMVIPIFQEWMILLRFHDWLIRLVRTPPDQYDTTDVDIDQDEQQVDQKDHKEDHNSHEYNNANIDLSQDDNHDTPQEHDIDPIEESLETEDTVHEFSERYNQPVNRIQVVCQSVRSKNLVRSIGP